jgi:hypothetical protein
VEIGREDGVEGLRRWIGVAGAKEMYMCSACAGDYEDPDLTAGDECEEETEAGEIVREETADEERR